MNKLITLFSLILSMLIMSTAWADLNSDLFEAVKKGDKGKVAALIQKGADVNAKNIKGKTPLDLASNDDMKKLLKKADSKSEILIQTASSEQKKVKIFIRKLIPGLNLKNILPYTPNDNTSYVQLYPIGFSKKGHFAYMKIK